MFMEATSYFDDIDEQHKGKGQSASKEKRAKVEKYLTTICGGKNRSYWFLLGAKYPSVKDDPDYISYFGRQ